jgi:hypothetical protein
MITMTTAIEEASRSILSVGGHPKNKRAEKKRQENATLSRMRRRMAHLPVIDSASNDRRNSAENAIERRKAIQANAGLALSGLSKLRKKGIQIKFIPFGLSASSGLAGETAERRKITSSGSQETIPS